MSGKMTKSEKVLEIIAIIFLIVSIIMRSIIGAKDTGTLVILSFVGILMWFIFLVCSFFPADWRMTEKQKNKINNPMEYQNRYRRIMIVLDVAFAVLFAILNCYHHLFFFRLGFSNQNSSAILYLSITDKTCFASN
jgi:hypothetical protein